MRRVHHEDVNNAVRLELSHSFSRCSSVSSTLHVLSLLNMTELKMLPKSSWLNGTPDFDSTSHLDLKPLVPRVFKAQNPHIHGPYWG